MDALTFELAETAGCGAGCTAFLERWWRFWSEHAAVPVAILTCEGYVDALGPNARKVIRQARHRYTFREFQIGEHAAAVETLNQSKAETTYGPTYGWVAGPVFPLPDYFPDCCELHSDRWFGGFDADEVLRGYIRLIRMNATLGLIHSIFRHAEDSRGVLNGVFAHIAEHGDVEFFSYHTMDVASHTGRPVFKRRTGFRDTQLRFTS